VIRDWQDDESHPTLKSVDIEVAVECEDSPQLVALGDTNERSVGEVHRNVAVLPHQLFHTSDIGCVQRKQLQHTVRDHVA